METKNLIIVCVTIIICLAIIAGVLVFLNNGSTDSAEIDDVGGDANVIKSVDDLKIPSIFKHLGGWSYAEEGMADGLMIMEYGDDDAQKYLVDGSIISITKNPDNTYYYVDGQNNEHGVVEAFEIDNEQYIAVFWFGQNCNYNMDEVDGIVSEFNQMNNITPFEHSGPVL